MAERWGTFRLGAICDASLLKRSVLFRPWAPLVGGEGGNWKVRPMLGGVIAGSEENGVWKCKTAVDRVAKKERAVNVRRMA